MSEFEIFLKEVEVADAYCESAISNAWLEACMSFTESEASDRLKDAKADIANAQADILDSLGYVIDSVIAAIENFFQMLREKLRAMKEGISGAIASAPKLNPKYKMILRECENAYAEYLKRLEKVVDDDIRVMGRSNNGYRTMVDEPKLQEICMTRVQKCVAKAVTMKSSTVDMLTDDMFDRIQDMGVQFQRKLRTKSSLRNNKVIQLDRRIIRYASAQAGHVCRAIPREMLKAL